jgi:RsiW-degrading membrane proteinase PrsW (M82 family)
MIIGTIALVLLAVASFPALVILIYVYVKDRTEREPGGLLLKLLLGGFLATAFAIVFEIIGEKILAGIEFASADQKNFIKYMFVVALSEEFFKYIVMRKVTWKNPNFNCSYDGVVYGVFTSLGFAILENVLYIINGGISTALVRAVTAIPGHASFGVFMGVFYAFAKRQKVRGNHASSGIFEVLAVLLPMTVHGIYDYATTLSSLWLFIAFIVVLFILSFIMIRYMAKNDNTLHGGPLEEAPVVEVPDDGPTSTVGHVIIEPAKKDSTKNYTNYRTK